MIEYISTEIIDGNPYQRRLDLGDVQALADDIAINGMVSIPLARRVGDRVQLAFGHRRRAAWELSRPGQRMPLEVREITDRQMADYVIAENSQRKDLSAIEKAVSIQDYIAEFDVTQTEAASRFGMTQAAASNLLRLLKLPEPTRELVHLGELPERLARQLVPLVEAAPKEVVRVAAEVAKLETGDKEEGLVDGMADILKKAAKVLDRDGGWPLDWKPESPPAPVTAPCKACPHHVELKGRGWGDYCIASGGCFEAMQQAWLDHELARLSKKYKVPIGPVDGETVYVLDLTWNNRHKAEELLKKKKSKCFRLIPKPKGERDWHYSEHKSVLGSDVVLLGSTEKGILDKKAAEIRKEAAANATPEELAAMNEVEEEKREEGRQQRAALRRARHDIAWMVANAAEAMAKKMVCSGGILDLVEMWQRNNDRDPDYQWVEYTHYIKTLDRKVKKSEGAERELALRTYIIARHMGAKISAYRPEEQFDFARAIGKVKESAAAFWLGLPVGWDNVPVHKTATNCHVCGRFSSMDDRITKIEEGQGWQVDKKGRVTCSEECRSR